MNSQKLPKRVAWTSKYVWHLEFHVSWLGLVVAPLPRTLQEDRTAGDDIFLTNHVFLHYVTISSDRLFYKRYIYIHWLLIKAFLGLDNAGKTSLVQLLSTGVVHQVFVTPIENYNSYLSQPKQRIVNVLWMIITLKPPERPNYASNHRGSKFWQSLANNLACREKPTYFTPSRTFKLLQ